MYQDFIEDSLNLEESVVMCVVNPFDSNFRTPTIILPHVTPNGY